MILFDWSVGFKGYLTDKNKVYDLEMRLIEHIKINIKNTIKMVDRYVLGGRIARLWSNYKMLHGEQIYNFRSLKGRRFENGKRIRVISRKKLSINDIILCQYYNNDFLHYMYYDIGPRMMAIEEYYGKSEGGFDVYRRMQQSSGFDWTDRYKKLIQSYEVSRYNEDSVIELDSDLNIMDGSHRIILGYYHGQEFINADIFNTIRKRSFNIDFFWSNGFSPIECKMIKEKTETIFESALYPFIGVIWPPAYKYKDEIFKDMNSYYSQEIKIIDYKDMYLEKGEFDHLFLALYHTDILDEAGVHSKIELINHSMTEEEKSQLYPICVFKLWVDNPEMGINPKNNQTQSTCIKRMKTTFRNRYKSKIHNYQYDVMMHITDNYIQSKFVSILLEINRDISDFYDRIEKIPYIVIRAKESRQHSEFPHKIYFRSNSDIIVRDKESLKLIGEIALRYSLEHFKNDWVEVKQVGGMDMCKIQIYLLDFMIYQFEISLHINGLSDSFRESCFLHCLKGDYYYLPVEDEIIIRLVEFSLKPQKNWYLSYLRKNLKFIDVDRLYNSVDLKIINKRKLSKILKKLGENK